jgi:hypothetical protein
MTITNQPTARQRTALALREFADFITDWTPPAARGQFGPGNNAAEQVRQAIRAIVPDPDELPLVGRAVFKVEHDSDYDRERPSGFVHTMISAVFENPTQADNAYLSRVKRGDGHYIICEIRQLPRDRKVRPVQLDQGTSACMQH